MIDPDNITRFDRTEEELHEFLLFCIAVAGKNAHNTSRALEKFLTRIKEDTLQDRALDAVLEVFSLHGIDKLIHMLLSSGFGCYSQRATSYLALARLWHDEDLDVSKASIQQLEEIPGVGPKTARFFALHSREGARCAVIDRHVLAWMKSKGCRDLPKTAPRSAKSYLRIERKFLTMCRTRKVKPADLDLIVWRSRRVKTTARS